MHLRTFRSCSREAGQDDQSISFHQIVKDISQKEEGRDAETMNIERCLANRNYGVV
jgi:hypothetical protein